ncbi:MAG: DUF1566 domain-containing protein, partial [Calditrichae bacterium]|nr:DUF1566 domain-containing protein [Calditrichia bacterium]
MIIQNGFFDIYLNENGAGIANDYEIKKEGMVVVDYRTGLMWQRSGSPYHMFSAIASRYIDSLNAVNYAGYNDWRLPTLEEALSIMENQRQQNNGLHIDPVFDDQQWWILTSDKDTEDWEWIVYYSMGYCSQSPVGNFSTYVRAVRRLDDLQLPEETQILLAENTQFSQIMSKSEQPRILNLRSSPQNNLTANQVGE